MSFVAIGVGVAAIGTAYSVYSAERSASANEDAMTRQNQLNQTALDKENNQIATNKGNQVRDAEEAQADAKTAPQAGRAGTILTQGQPTALGNASAQSNTSGGTKTVLGA